MRCHSVQALWASTPPAHQVMVMVALKNPPSLWTGGSRGDIIYWKLPPPLHPPQDLWPVALLCGHRTEVADIVACKVDEERENRVFQSDAEMVEKDGNFYEIVVSVCTEGWICSWDSLTGRCKRRRKLPPWVGTPCIMKTLPQSQRYIAICCDGSIPGSFRNVNGNDVTNEFKKIANDDDREISLERSASIKKEMRGTILVVDSSSLAIVQVVFHGLLGIGTVKALALFTEADLSHKLIISDQSGQIRAWNITLDKREKSENGSEQLWKEYSSSETDFGGNTKSVSLSFDGSYVLLVLSTHWVVISTKDQIIVQESSQLEGNPPDISWVGGLFLVGTNVQTMPENRQYIFFIWDSQGGATLYSMQNTCSNMAMREVFQLPPFSSNPELQYTVRYCQLSDLLICVTCSNSPQEIPDTQIRVWVLPYSVMCYLDFKEPEILLMNACSIENDNTVKHEEFTLYGEGSLRFHWSDISFSHLPGRSEVDVDSTLKEPLLADSSIEWVTSSMVLFDKSSTPAMFVLGFNSGNIKLILLRTTLVDGEENGFTFDGKLGCFVQSLNKHVGPVTCLAELSLSNEALVSNIGKRFLISGGMDCWTCIWDMGNPGNPLMTLHHHVTPVHQIILPPLGTYAPWSNCFITVGEDGCIALVSLETLQVERMFVGHPSQPKMISWDGLRGYLCCLCATSSDVLFMWDIKSGALERVLRGAAAHTMYDNFARQVQGTSITNALFDIQANSIASLLHGDTGSPGQFSGFNHVASTESNLHQASADEKRPNSGDISSNKTAGSLERLSMRFNQVLNPNTKITESHLKHNGIGSNSTDVANRNLFHKHPPIKGVSPFPGVVAVQFDLFTLMAPDLGHLARIEREEWQTKMQSSNMHLHVNQDSECLNEDGSVGLDRKIGVDLASNVVDLELLSTLGSAEGRILRTSLAFLHLWGADLELDKCLQKELRITPPMSTGTAAGFAGDRGATTLLLPGWKSTFEMWKSSAEFCALRSLTIVATALRMTTISRLTCNANSALAAFYTRELVEMFPSVKAPSLELYSCFWQDPSEYVRMAARSLFHCAASRAMPSVLSAKGAENRGNNGENGLCYSTKTLLMVEQTLANKSTHAKATWPDSVCASNEIIDWLESYEGKAWTAVIGGTSQDGRSGRIIVGAALAVWYPCLVRPELAPSVAPYLVKLVKAIVDRHSAVAAELLADGMETVWRHLIAEEIPSLISDIFLLIECLTAGGTSKPSLVSNPATAVTIRETLSGSLLPSLAMADIASFLEIVQNQLSSASLDSPLHLIALMTIIRIIRSAPRTVVYHLSQVIWIILHIMNTGKNCYQTAMAAAKEMVRVYPMVAFHQASGKLAVGDAAGDVHSLAIHVYDINSSSKLRVLDASGPPGHPALLMGEDTSNTGGISALDFSEDGEGVVAFSQHGLMIRWWSLNSVWWEKLSRVSTPIQCNKLVLVPPWSGFSPKSSRSSIMATISDISNSDKETQGQSHDDGQGRPVSHGIDLSFRLEWRNGKRLALLHHVQELGVFQL